MINLLPYDTKKQLRAARSNTTLARYVFTTIAASIFLGLLILGSYYILQSSKETAEEAIVNVQTENSSYSPSTSRANEFNSDLEIASKILDQQISYGVLLSELAKIMPSGFILESPLSISKTSIDSSLTLKAFSKNSTDEVIKSSFQSSKIFSDYSLQSLNNNANSSGYPYLITFSVNVNKAQLK